ncbi:hypothetical protein C4F40_05535 [Sphingobacterium sp. Ka21]|uniref:Uncharacterized protein n=1 Tax=Sphingobacterium pedocola TaxID=2082722 RepID=A0ABR9T4C2_9SPHI|nr:hypothetical protein [Sphingobacterium pedocola]
MKAPSWQRRIGNARRKKLPKLILHFHYPPLTLRLLQKRFIKIYEETKGLNEQTSAQLQQQFAIYIKFS